MPSSSAVGDIYPSIMSIDLAYRTDEVYKYCSTNPARLWPTGGAANPDAQPMRRTEIKSYPGLLRRMLNVNYWKDYLHGLIHDPDEDKWLAHSQVSEDYIRQMSSEHKVLEPRKRRWTWMPISSGADNHYWDCEYNQVAMAQELQVQSASTIANSIQVAKIQTGRQQDEKFNDRPKSERVEPARSRNWATDYRR